MASPKYCSWDVKELAIDYGWTELPTHPQDEDKMMRFFSGKHEGVTVNVNLHTGTVATSLEHPLKGKTQLYRGQRNTLGQLVEVFDNPRVLTDSGYKTRAKLREAAEEEEGVPRGIPHSEDVYSNEYEETTSIQYDLFKGLADIENLRIEENEGSCDSEDNEMTNLLTQGRLMFESGSESDGELPLNKWDEEEIESEEVSASEGYDHLEDSEFSNSSGESEKGIENCIHEKDTSDSGDNNSFLNETGDSEFYHNDESDASSSSNFENPVTESGNDSYDDTTEDSDDFNDF